MKHKQTRKKILFVVIAILLAALTLFILEKTRVTNIIKDPFYTPTPVDRNNSNDDPTLGSKSTLPAKDATVTTPTGNTSQIPVSDTTSVSFDSLAQANSVVTYEATITSPGQDGTCSIQFAKADSKPVSRVSAASVEKCGPVSIPELEFESIGTWTATLRYYTGDTQAITTKTVEIH